LIVSVDLHASTKLQLVRYFTTHTRTTITPHQYLTFDNMGVTKKMITPGNGTDKPKSGDTITMEYTGNLYASDQPENKGKQYAPPSTSLQQTQ